MGQSEGWKHEALANEKPGTDLHVTVDITDQAHYRTLSTWNNFVRHHQNSKKAVDKEIFCGLDSHT